MTKDLSNLNFGGAGYLDTDLIIGMRPTGDTTADDCIVTIAGKVLPPSKRGLQHSPDGHNFGYGGSGPACLAHSILTEVFDTPTADQFYQDFKWALIATLDQDAFELPIGTVRAWLRAKTTGIA